jgi:hypothetical protein
VEKALCKEVKAAGGIPFKFTSPSCKNVPDRICLFKISPEDRKIVAKYVRFVEVKDEGKFLRPGQLRMMTKLSDMGFYCETRDHK